MRLFANALFSVTLRWVAALSTVVACASSPPPGTWTGSCSCAAPPASTPVRMVGQVREPGPRPYEDGMTALRAVALAGGYTAVAERGSIRVHRCDDACTFVVPIEGRETGDTFLRPGDVVEVPASAD